MKRLYETTIVIDPQLKSTEIEDTIKKVTTFITNHGGDIVKVDEWGKRRLAYEINKKQYGYYVHIRFQAPGQIIHLLEREYKLSEAILRYLTIKVDKLALKMERILQEKQAKEAEAAQHAAAATEQATQTAQPEPEAADQGDSATASGTSDTGSANREAPAETESTQSAEGTEPVAEASSAASTDSAEQTEENS